MMGKVTYEITKWGDEYGYGCEIKETIKGWFKTTTKTWTLIPSAVPCTQIHQFSRWTCAETGESTYVDCGFVGEKIYRANYSLTKNALILTKVE